MLQPLISTLIEAALWLAIFRTAGVTEIGGFGKENYLSYVLWSTFLARITSTWMYEYRMIDEIETGSVNGLLARPVSFFEYYLSQFLGYKLITSAVSLLFPLAACLYFGLPINLSRLPASLALIIYYLLLVHTMSFFIATLAFRLTKVGALTMAKNLGLWIFSGELFPLDLMPGAWKTFFLAMPFANAAYIPTAYLTGRADAGLLLQGFVSTTLGILFFGWIARRSWRKGLLMYSGTGA